MRRSKFFGFSNHVFDEPDIFSVEKISKFYGFSYQVISFLWERTRLHFLLSLRIRLFSEQNRAIP